MTSNPYTKFRRRLSRGVEIFFEALIVLLIGGYAYGFGWEIASLFSSGTAALLWAIPLGIALFIAFVLAMILFVGAIFYTYFLISKFWYRAEHNWESKHGGH